MPNILYVSCLEHCTNKSLHSCNQIYSFKLRERFEFPDSLDMYRYTAEGLEAQESNAAQLTPPDITEIKPRLYYQYYLKGIVVHSGTAFAGHYYSYIKERPYVANGGQVKQHMNKILLWKTVGNKILNINQICSHKFYLAQICDPISFIVHLIDQ